MSLHDLGFVVVWQAFRNVVVHLVNQLGYPAELTRHYDLPVRVNSHIDCLMEVLEQLIHLNLFIQ